MQENNNDVLDKVAVRLLPFMFCLYIASYLDRINVSFAGLEMNRDLGFNDEVFGLGSGIFFLGYFIFGVPSNLMVAKLGASRWIALITVCWGIVSTCMAFVNSKESFYILRFFLGVFEAGFFPGMILYLTYWFPKSRHGLAVARFMTAIPAAGVLGGLVASAIFKLSSIAGQPGWKLLFILTGLPTVFLGIASLFLLPDRPQDAHWLSDSELASLSRTLESEREELPAGAQSSTLSALTIPRVWFFAVLYFTLTLAMYGFQLWLPQIIRSAGVKDDVITALISAIPALFQAVGMVLIARHSDKTGERRLHVAASALIAAIGFASTAVVTIAYPGNPWLAVATLSVTALGIWGTVGPFWALPTAYLSPAAAAAGIAFINSVGNLGGFVGPSMIGLVKSHSSGFTMSLFMMAASLMVTCMMAYSIRPVAPDAVPESKAENEPQAETTT